MLQRFLLMETGFVSTEENRTKITYANMKAGLGAFLVYHPTKKESGEISCDDNTLDEDGYEDDEEMIAIISYKLKMYPKRKAVLKQCYEKYYPFLFDS